MAIFIVELSSYGKVILLAGRHNRDGSFVYFHHKTSKLYAMSGRFDCAVHPFPSLRFVCRILIIDLFDWETSKHAFDSLKARSVCLLINNEELPIVRTRLVSAIIDALSSFNPTVKLWIPYPQNTILHDRISNLRNFRYKWK